MKNNKKQGMKHIFSNNLFVLKILFGATPVYGISIVVEAVRHNLINFLEQTICVYMILDAIELGKPYKTVVYVVALFLVVDILAAAISNLYEHFIKLRYLPIAQQKLKLKLYAKAGTVDISCYDNVEYYNDFMLSVSEADRAIERAEQIIRMLFGSVTVLFCYGLFFVTQDITSIIFVVGSFAIRTVFSNFRNKWRYKIRLKENPLERKREYIKRVFYLKKYAKDLRLNKEASKELHKEFDLVNQELYEMNKKMAPKRFLLDFIARYLAIDFALDIVYVMYLVIKAAVYHLLSFSEVVVLYNSASNLRRGLSTVIDMGPYAVETSLYVDKIRSFLRRETEIKSERKKEIPVDTGVLECRNVSFGYTKDKLILKKINIKIDAKEKVALVGYNGAGKTTLIKLLLRLYEPTEGDIFLNGVNIKDYDLGDYRKYIGVVFQDFQLFAANVAENVIMDNVEGKDQNKILDAIRMGGFYDRYKKLPYGLQTELTQEFDDSGIDLSGGEGQKLAVTRAFYKKSGLLLLDEPSSALDPISEYKLNMAMNEMAKEKTVIFISHRLSTTRRADKIYVLENGEIMESGTHNELISKEGIYAKMWNVQARKYY